MELRAVPLRLSRSARPVACTPRSRIMAIALSISRCRGPDATSPSSPT
ncbi:Uncharacterised protein [Mycobacteroides abscessus subsp. abscessus]|nr:Uncharacterised protein [Mycobacteroides abscessus subsp. abscessus]